MHVMNCSAIDMTKFPRFQLLDGPTPIQHLARLSSNLGGPDIFVKRDDLMGLGGGGNKVRKLEFLVGAALAQGADTIITVGAWQSNHARLTAAAASRAGLSCELFLTRTVPRGDMAYLENGNILLDGLFGAYIHPVSGNIGALMAAEQRAEELRSVGKGVYIAPFGGSSEIGCLGYAACALEILDQCDQLGISFDRIILPNGTGGTHAGLVAGLIALGQKPSTVQAFSVLNAASRARPITLEKARDTLALLNSSMSVDDADIVIDDHQLGEGYGVPTNAMRHAVRTLASTEGFLIDPVYGGKAFAGLLSNITRRQYGKTEKILFLMTGGLPGLFAYQSAF